MPYTVFALKWRPQNFDEIVGQNHIVDTLKNAIQKSRLAHAYLFAGPRGVGKTSTARILAKTLNCKGGSAVNPCQRCSSCIEITGGRSLDVIEIDGASNRGIDEIRTLRESVKFAPTQGKFKIYIIDEVHMLTQEAFNALLKTLEEPPEFVKFIFATTRPNKVLPTILSRCQRFDFRRIPVMEIIKQLENIINEEKIDIEKEVIFAIARSSDGSLRDAESVLDQLTSFSKGKISLKDVVSVLGLVEQEVLFRITEKIIQKDAKGALGLFNKIIDEGKDISVFLSNLIEHFRNLMIAKITKADPKLIDLPEDVCQNLLKQSENFSLEEIFSAFNILVNAQEMAKRLDSLRIPLEINLVRLAHDKKIQARTQVNPSQPHKPQPQEPYNERAESTKKEKASSEPVKNEDAGLKKIEPVKAVTFDNIKEAWQKIIDNLQRIKMSVATYLNEGIPTKIQENTLTISFPKNYSLHKESLESKENKAIIEKSISDVFNTNLKVRFMLTEESKQKEENASTPFIKSALETFGGKIIKEE